MAGSKSTVENISSSFYKVVYKAVTPPCIYLIL